MIVVSVTILKLSKYASVYLFFIAGYTEADQEADENQIFCSVIDKSVASEIIPTHPSGKSSIRSSKSK